MILRRRLQFGFAQVMLWLPAATATVWALGANIPCDTRADLFGLSQELSVAKLVI
jgi:hypothetical protein